MRRIATLVGMITLVFWSAAAPTADADFPTLPNAMKGRWNYDNRYSNTWSIVIDKTNTDGTFDGKITFYGVNCNARGTPIVNGRIKLGEMTFSADFGFRCTNVAFVLRKGKDHLLEGELRTDAGPLTNKVWLDADK